MQRPEEESEKHACIKAEEAYRSSCITPGNVGIDIVVHLCHSVTSERNCSFYNVRNVAKNETDIVVSICNYILCKRNTNFYNVMNVARNDIAYVVRCFMITCIELFRFIMYVLDS